VRILCRNEHGTSGHYRRARLMSQGDSDPDRRILPAQMRELWSPCPGRENILRTVRRQPSVSSRTSTATTECPTGSPTPESSRQSHPCCYRWSGRPSRGCDTDCLTNRPGSDCSRIIHDDVRSSSATGRHWRFQRDTLPKQGLE